MKYSFPKGYIPWNKGKTGIKTNNKGLVPWNKGEKMSLDTRQKMSIARKGTQLSLETRKRISEAKKGKMPKNIKYFLSQHLLKGDPRIKTGEQHHSWKGGFVARGKHTLADKQYVDWRKLVFKRDNFKCRILNQNCNGQLEVHHILNWAEFIELRYEINNGITLCHAHHPRGRTKEKQLAPMLQELVLASKEF